MLHSNQKLNQKKIVVYTHASVANFAWASIARISTVWFQNFQLRLLSIQLHID